MEADGTTAVSCCGAVCGRTTLWVPCPCAHPFVHTAACGTPQRRNEHQSRVRQRTTQAAVARASTQTKSAHPYPGRVCGGALRVHHQPWQRWRQRWQLHRLLRLRCLGDPHRHHLRGWRAGQRRQRRELRQRLGRWRRRRGWRRRRQPELPAVREPLRLLGRGAATGCGLRATGYGLRATGVGPFSCRSLQPPAASRQLQHREGHGGRGCVVALVHLDHVVEGVDEHPGVVGAGR